MVIDFKYAINNSAENINQENKGTVMLQGNKYVLSFMGVTKIYDGKKIYTIVPEDEEITISKFDDNDDNAVTPSKMLTFFQSGYKYSWDILQNVKNSISLKRLGKVEEMSNLIKTIIDTVALYLVFVLLQLPLQLLCLH